jgi:hypothetical protein
VSGAAEQVHAGPGGPGEPRPGRRRWGRWLLAGTVAWAVLLAGLTYLSTRTDGPTFREQRSLDRAGPVVDRAVGALAAAAGDDVAVELTAARVARGCRLTPFRRGATLEREVLVRVGTGADPRPLLDRIADRLPVDYRAGVSVTDEGPRLRADGGEFVTVEGRLVGEGLIRLTADTGCRPVGAGYTPDRPDSGTERAALEQLLRALGQRGAEPPDVVTAPCPGAGGTSRTARVTVQPYARSGPLGPTVGPLSGPSAVVLVDSADVYAARAAATSTVAEAADDRLHLAVTTTCAR